jgi:tetratricopeptide (TPR) repeat protein
MMFKQPKLAELTARYLAGQGQAHAAGLGAPAAGEVEPYDAASPAPVDLKAAWADSTDALRQLAPKAAVAKAPEEWSSAAAVQSEAAVAFAAGNFPQMIRDLQWLTRTPLTDLAPNGRPARAVEVKAAAVAGDFARSLLAVAALRLAGQFDRAADLLDELRSAVPEEWRSAFANEEASLAWHAGRCEEAADRWDEMPESAPVLFNRGMAALFLGRPADAREPLKKAAALMPEGSGWHHLAKLYLALAEMGR